jgi:hypothetical protein
MSTLAINLTKVAVVVVIYLFLWFVARSVRAQVAPTTSRHAPAPAVPSLVVLSPEETAGRTMEVRRTLVVGRGEAADLLLDDGFTSERHARFENVDGFLSVEDLGSTNGTFVNGERIDARTPLTPGDAVRIGGTIMEAR